MMTAAALLFLFGCLTVIYPIRALGISRRRHGVFMIAGAFVLAMVAAPAAPQSKGSGQGVSSAPTFQSSGNCRTDASGAYRCDSETNWGWLGSSSSSMVCRKNPVTDQTDCKWESSAR
jgi:hypothetical protein